MRYKLLNFVALVPLTEDGRIVLQQAVNFQKFIPSRIIVTHVVPPVSFFIRIFNPQRVKELKQEALAKLTDFVTDFFQGEVPDHLIYNVVMGEPVKQVIKQGKSDDFLILILKRSLKERKSACVLGQKSIDRIIGHSRCPVLSLNEGATRGDIRKILIPIDISESTRKRLFWASMFATKMKAKVQIVSALKANIDEHKSLAFRNADKVKTMLERRGIDCEVEILRVHKKIMHEAVLSYIFVNRPDFVVIRAHQVESEKKHVGLFAKQIIHGSPVPVFTVSQAQSDIASLLT